jgi:hypothetical protein
MLTKRKHHRIGSVSNTGLERKELAGDTTLP